MRKLTWAAVGFGAAAFLAEYFLPVQGLPYFAAALALFLPPCFLLKERGRLRSLLLIGSAVLGVLAWGWHYERHVGPCEAMVGEMAAITAEAVDYPVRWEDYAELTVRVKSGAPEEKAVLYLYGEIPPVEPGDRLEMMVYFRSVMEENGRRLHNNRTDGEYLRGYVRGEVTVLQRELRPWLHLPKIICQNVEELCDELFAPDTAPVMKALLTGDVSDLCQDTELYSDMRMAGMLHVVAVSGMHLVVLMAMMELVFGKSRRTSLMCIPMLTVFVFMAGCRASILRAAVMHLVSLFAPILRRENDRASSLSAALLVILVINPMAIGGAGLQLSFACMLGFVLLLPGIRRWISEHLPVRNGAVRFLAKSISASLCAMAFSLPATVCYFGTIPLLSPLANLLTLPVTEICFGTGYGLCILGLVWPGAAKAGAWVTDWGIRWCMLVYDRIAAVPFACLYSVRDAAVWWLVSLYGIWIGWYLLRRKKKPVGVTAPVCLCVLGLCAVLLTGSAGFRDGSAELTVLDVGQGQSVALLEDSGAVLIDCGGTGGRNAGDTAANYLLASGKKRLDALVLTHLHEDHANGVEDLLTRIPVDTILLPAGADDGDKMLEKIETAAEAYGVNIIALEEPCTLRVGAMELGLYLPQAGTDENERGIVVLAEIAGQTACIMGDAGEDAELALLADGCVTDVDVLVVGHHGSKTASGPMFLKAVRAETAVISVGNNGYGLPAGEVLDRLSRYCLRVLRTDEDGTITIQMETDELIYG